MSGFFGGIFYSEGSWTPIDTSGAALSFSSVSANYTRIGRMVFAYCALTYPATADGTVASIGGLPFTVAGAQYARQGSFSVSSIAAAFSVNVIASDTSLNIKSNVGNSLTNAQVSGGVFYFECIYPVS